MDIEIITAFCLMPLVMVIATLGWIWMFCIFSCLPILLGLYYYKSAIQVKSRFYLGWSSVSFFFLLAVFELEVVPYLEILFSENLCLMCSVGAMCLFFFLVKSNSTLNTQSIYQNERVARTRCEICSFMQPARTLHCDLCGYCVLKRDHHNVWLDACIGSRNQRYFVGGLLCLIFSSMYSSNLTLTTICHPTLVAGMILLPDDCSDVFGDFHVAICFVSAVYTVMIAVYSIFLLIQQVFFVCYNATYQEWKEGSLGLYSNGWRRNVMDFWYGCN